MRRRLKIAWTAFFAVLTVALCVLWVRSYWKTDMVAGPYSSAQGFNFASLQGELGVVVLPFAPSGKFEFNTFDYREDDFIFAHPRFTNFGFGYGGVVQGSKVVAPYWFVAVVIGALGSIPWFPWPTRFSLRSMLIATTLIAVALALTVFLARK